jgi:hypothetical protein
MLGVAETGASATMLAHAHLPAPGTPLIVTATTTGPSARVSSHSGAVLSFAVWVPLLGLVGGGNRFVSRQKKVQAVLFGCVLFGEQCFRSLVEVAAAAAAARAHPPLLIPLQ